MAVKIRKLIVQVDEFLIEDAQDAVETPVDLLDAFVVPGLGDDTCDACVDDAGGTTRLGDEEIAIEFSHIGRKFG